MSKDILTVKVLEIYEATEQVLLNFEETINNGVNNKKQLFPLLLELNDIRGLLLNLENLVLSDIDNRFTLVEIEEMIEFVDLSSNKVNELWEVIQGQILHLRYEDRYSTIKGSKEYSDLLRIEGLEQNSYAANSLLQSLAVLSDTDRTIYLGVRLTSYILDTSLKAIKVIADESMDVFENRGRQEAALEHFSNAFDSYEEIKEMVTFVESRADKIIEQKGGYTLEERVTKDQWSDPFGIRLEFKELESKNNKIVKELEYYLDKLGFSK